MAPSVGMLGVTVTHGADGAQLDVLDLLLQGLKTRDARRQDDSIAQRLVAQLDAASGRAVDVVFWSSHLVNGLSVRRFALVSVESYSSQSPIAILDVPVLNREIGDAYLPLSDLHAPHMRATRAEPRKASCGLCSKAQYAVRIPSQKPSNLPVHTTSW